MSDEIKRIKGEDVIFAFDSKQALHAQTHTLNVNLEVKDFRTKHTNGKQRSPGDIDWDISADGVVVIDPSITNAVSADGILQMLMSKKEIPVMFKSNVTGVMKEYTGKGFITKYTQTSQAGEDATYSISFTGSGDFAPVTPEGE